MAGLRLKLAEPCLAVPSPVPSFSSAWQSLVSSFHAVPWVHSSQQCPQKTALSPLRPHCGSCAAGRVWCPTYSSTRGWGRTTLHFQITHLMRHKSQRGGRLIHAVITAAGDGVAPAGGSRRALRVFMLMVITGKNISDTETS